MLLWGILLMLICGCLISLLSVFVEETKGIILSIAGAILFLLGIHIVGIILVIAGIIVYNYAKDSDKKANIEKLKKYHQQKMYSLVEQCWNSKTCDFNWSLWIDKKDEIFYDDSDFGLKKTAQAELQSLGKTQIKLLNMYLDLMLMCGKVTNDNLIDSSHYFRNTDQYEKLMWGFSYISFCLSKHFGESDVFVSFLLTASL